MYKPECSYLITVTDTPTKTWYPLLYSLQSHKDLTDFTVSVDNGTITCGLPSGSIPETDSITDAVMDISGRFPESVFTIQKTCEEPYTPDETAIISGGSMGRQQYSRHLGPEEIDLWTIRECVKELEKAGETQAATCLRRLASRHGLLPVHAENIAERFLEAMNPERWDGTGLQPDSFQSATVWDFTLPAVMPPSENNIRLDISFEFGPVPDSSRYEWTHCCELVDEETNTMVEILSGSGINDPEAIANTILELCWDKTGD